MDSWVVQCAIASALKDYGQSHSISWAQSVIFPDWQKSVWFQKHCIWWQVCVFWNDPWQRSHSNVRGELILGTWRRDPIFRDSGVDDHEIRGMDGLWEELVFLWQKDQHDIEKVIDVLEEGPHFIPESWYVPFNYQGFSGGSLSLGQDCIHFVWLLNHTLLLVHWGWELKPVPSRQSNLCTWSCRTSPSISRLSHSWNVWLTATSWLCWRETPWKCTSSIT